MTAADLDALDVALGEWVASLVVHAASGDTQHEGDDVRVIPPSCGAGAGRVGDGYTRLFSRVTARGQTRACVQVSEAGGPSENSSDSGQGTARGLSRA